MASSFTTNQTPAGVWLLGSLDASGATETQSVLSLAAPLVVAYADGTGSDTLPALTPAVVYGGSSTTFDRTAYVWLAITVVGSGVLKVIKEADVNALDVGGVTYAVLARILRHAITAFQQS